MMNWERSEHDDTAATLPWKPIPSSSSSTPAPGSSSSYSSSSCASSCASLSPSTLLYVDSTSTHSSPIARHSLSLVQDDVAGPTREMESMHLHKSFSASQLLHHEHSQEQRHRSYSQQPHRHQRQLQHHHQSSTSRRRRRRRTQSEVHRPKGWTPRSRRENLVEQDHDHDHDHDQDIPMLEDDPLSDFHSAEEAEEQKEALDQESDAGEPDSRRRATQEVDVMELLDRLSTNSDLEREATGVEDIALLDDPLVPRKSMLSSRSYPTLHGTLSWLENKRHALSSSTSASPANASPSNSTGSASSARHALTSRQLSPAPRSIPTLKYSQSTSQVIEAHNNHGGSFLMNDIQLSSPYQSSCAGDSSRGHMAAASSAFKSVHSASGLLSSHSWESGSSLATSPSTSSFAMKASTTSSPSSSSAEFKVELVRAGFLLKQSDVLRAWKRRYFVLMTRCHQVNGKQIALLQYFKHNQFGRVRGEVVLNDNNPKVMIRFLDPLQIRRPFCFEVRKGNTCTMICQGRDEEDVSAWVCLLRNLAALPCNTWITTFESGILRSAGSVGHGDDLLALSTASGLSSSPGSLSNSTGMSNSSRYRSRRGTHSGSIASRRSIRMVAELRRLLHNPQSQEAMECRNFVKNFDFRKHSNPLETIYAFENRMINMIMQTHAERILNQIHRKDERTSSNIGGTASPVGTTAHASIPDGTSERMVGPTERSSDYGPLSAETLQAMQEMLQLVRHHVEEAIILPLQHGIRCYLQRKHVEEEAAVNRRLRWLQGKDQAYFNIPLHQVSWKEWRQASQILGESTLSLLPAEQLDAVVNCLENIQWTFADEVSKRSGNTGGSNNSASSSTSSSSTVNANSTSEVLEVDDLVPIFTYVLANSGLENLYAYKELISELTFEPTRIIESSADKAATPMSSADDLTSSKPSSVLLTKATVMSIFNDALEFISNMSIPAVLEEIFKDQVTLAIEQDWRCVFEFEVEPTYSYGAMVHHVTQRGFNTFGNSVVRNHILVSLNGQNVVLWPYPSIFRLLKSSRPPHRLGFIPSSSYFKILTSNKSLWNVALMHACQRGDLASVQMLLSNGADVNYVGYECAGNTPLHVAVSASHFPVVSFLLQHGAKAKTVGEFGRNASHFVGSPCCMPSSDLNSLTGVLSSSFVGGSGNKLSLTERICLIIKKLVNYGVPVEACDAFGNTPLMFLAEKGYLQAIDLLVASKHFLNLNKRNWVNGKNALMIAATEGRYEIVEALLDYGADLHVVSLAGETALHFAAAIACKNVCALLLERGSNVNARTNSGCTPLMMTASRGRCLAQEITGPNESMHIDDSVVNETLDLLLQSGANPHLACTKHRNALYYAALFGGPDVFGHFLRQLGGGPMDLEQRDLLGKTMMKVVESALPASLDHQKVLQLLIASLSCALSMEDEEAMETMHAHCAVRPKLTVATSTLTTTGAITSSTTTTTSTSTLSNSHVSTAGTHSEDNSGSSANLVHHCCALLNGVVTEEPNADGNYEIVSGSFDALLNGLFQFRQYQVSDVEAFIWCCDKQQASAIVRHLRRLLEHAQEAAIASPGSAAASELRYVRRMILHALNAIVESLQNQLQVNWELCREVYELFHAILVALAVSNADGRDPTRTNSHQVEDCNCIEWLEQVSLLGEFTNSFERRTMEHFQKVAHCEGCYGHMAEILKNVMQRNPWIMFFDEDLLHASGLEVITEDMRERLQVAGIWDSQSAKNMVVRPSNSYLSSSSTKSLRPSSRSSKGLSSSSSRSRTAKTTTSGSRRKRRHSSTSDPSNTLWILDVDIRHLAQQITLLQHFFFSRIKVYELLAGKKDADLTPSYERFRLLHNHLSLWIANQILAHQEVEHRALMLSYFIKVAGECLHSLRNLDGFMAVMNALNDSSIFRLKKTWMRLTPEAPDLWQECKKWTEKGARALHKLMKEMTMTTPAIPYLGLVLQQVVAFKEFPDLVDHKQVNFRKWRGLGGLIQVLMPFQKLPYLLPSDQRVLEQICAPLDSPDKETCFDRSLVVEPRLGSVVQQQHQQQQQHQAATSRVP